MRIVTIRYNQVCNQIVSIYKYVLIENVIYTIKTHTVPVIKVK